MRSDRGAGCVDAPRECGADGRRAAWAAAAAAAAERLFCTCSNALTWHFSFNLLVAL